MAQVQQWVSSMSGKSPSPATELLSGTALSSGELGPPAKSPQVTRLGGLFLRCNRHPRGRDLGSFHCALCSSDIHGLTNLSQVVFLVYHSKTPQSYSGHGKTISMEVPVAPMTPVGTG